LWLEVQSSSHFQIDFNTNLPPPSRFSNWPLSFQFSHQNSVHISCFFHTSCIYNIIPVPRQQTWRRKVKLHSFCSVNKCTHLSIRYASSLDSAPCPPTHNTRQWKHHKFCISSFLSVASMIVNFSVQETLSPLLMFFLNNTFVERGFCNCLSSYLLPLSLDFFP